jgi:hypothetical protein
MRQSSATGPTLPPQEVVLKDARGHGSLSGPLDNPKMPCRRCGGTLRYSGGTGRCVACMRTPDKLAADAERQRLKRAVDAGSLGKTLRASNSPTIWQARRAILKASVYELADPSVGVRQMYYYMVTHYADLIAKDDNGYKTVCRDIKALREDDPEFDWDLIEDGQRTVFQYATFRDHRDRVEAAIATFKLDYWHDHSHSVQVWLDKDGLAGTVQGITWGKYRVPLFGFRGMSSMSFLDKAAKQIAAEERDCKVLIFGDLDPTGYLAVQNIERRLQERVQVHSDGAAPAITVQHVALSDHEQVRQLGIASAFRETTVKRDKDGNLTNKHIPAFFERFGNGAESCEIDALHPDDLRRLVDVAVAKALTGERGERKALSAAAKLLESKQATEADEIKKLRKMVKS